MQNDELPINAAGVKVEEVTKADISVVDKDLENMPGAAKDHVVYKILEYDEHITEVATEKSDVVIDDNNMMATSFVDHEAGDRDTPNIVELRMLAVAKTRRGKVGVFENISVTFTEKQ